MTEGSVFKREFSAIGLTLFAVFLAGALAFQRVPPGGGCLDAAGAFGPIGTWTRCALVTTVGIPGAVLVAVGFLAVGLVLFGRLRQRDDHAIEWGLLLAGVVLGWAGPHWLPPEWHGALRLWCWLVPVSVFSTAIFTHASRSA